MSVSKNPIKYARLPLLAVETQPPALRARFVPEHTDGTARQGQEPGNSIGLCPLPVAGGYSLRPAEPIPSAPGGTQKPGTRAPGRKQERPLYVRECFSSFPPATALCSWHTPPRTSTSAPSSAGLAAACSALARASTAAASSSPLPASPAGGASPPPRAAIAAAASSAAFEGDGGIAAALRPRAAPRHAHAGGDSTTLS